MQNIQDKNKKTSLDDMFDLAMAKSIPANTLRENDAKMKKLFFKIKDIPLVEFEYSYNLAEEKRINILSVNKKYEHLLPMEWKGQVNDIILEGWLRNRIKEVPNSYYSSANFLSSGYKEKMGTTVFGKTIEATKGLSVFDSYWIAEETDRFRDFNLFENPLEKMLNRIDKAKDKEEVFRKYNYKSGDFQFLSAERKIPVDKYFFITKIGSNIEIFRGRESMNEYYLGQVQDAIGMDMFPMGIWKDEMEHIQPKVRDSIKNGVKLAGITTSIENDIEKFYKVFLTTRNFCTPELSYVTGEDFTKSIGKNNIDEAVELIKDIPNSCREKFEKMLLTDVITGNDYRRMDSFGFLRNNTSGEVLELAPIATTEYSLIDDPAMRGEIKKNPLFLNIIKNISISPKILENLKKFTFKEHQDIPLFNKENLENIIRQRAGELEKLLIQEQNREVADYIESRTTDSKKNKTKNNINEAIEDIFLQI